MMRKIIASLLVFMMLGGLVSCAGFGDTEGSTDTEGNSEQDTSKDSNGGDKDDENNKDDEDNKDDDKPTAVPTTVALNSSTAGIKIIGDRMLPSESQINCDWTCSGIEFVFESTGGPLTVKANSDGTLISIKASIRWELTVLGRGIVRLLTNASSFFKNSTFSYR